MGWIQARAPMDAQDLEFPADPAGRVLVTLVEENGHRLPSHQRLLAENAWHGDRCRV